MKTTAAGVCGLLLLIVAVSGCAPEPPPTPPQALADQTFASNAVLQELAETRPAFSALQPDEQAQVYMWLLANCAVDADSRRTKFVGTGSRGELALIESFRMGPPLALLAELVKQRRGEFAAIHEQLAGEDADLFDADLKTRVNEISENSYVADGINQITSSYRLSALEGLAAVGTKTSVAWLERTAPKLEVPELRSAAERTLEALRGKSKKELR